MITAIWKRHFLKELFLLFCFILIASYFLYALIDYSSHAKLFQKDSVTISQILLYYLYQLSKQGDLLLPIALLLTTLKVLLRAKTQNEIIALLAAGISFKKISRPFLLFTFFIMILSAWNCEYGQPFVFVKITQFEQIHLNKKPPATHIKVHPIQLKDNSLIIYQNFDLNNKILHDVIWLKNRYELYKMDSLSLIHLPPIGSLVDYLVRDPKSHKISLQSHFVKKEFLDLELSDTISFLFSPPRWQSFRKLAENLFMQPQQAEILTFFLYKLIIPLLSLLAGILPLCYCGTFSRNPPTLLIYAFSLFGIITLFTLLNASVILGKNQIINPFVGILLFPLIVTTFFGYKYAKL